MMGMSRSKTGQSIIEYTLIIAIIGAAVAAMSTYVYRAVQAKQKEIAVEAQKL